MLRLFYYDDFAYYICKKGLGSKKLSLLMLCLVLAKKEGEVLYDHLEEIGVQILEIDKKNLYRNLVFLKNLGLLIKVKQHVKMHPYLFYLENNEYSFERQVEIFEFKTDVLLSEEVAKCKKEFLTLAGVVLK